MIAWGKFPFVRFSVAVIAGILFYLFAGNPFSIVLYMLPLLAISYIIVVLALKRKNKTNGTLPGVLGFVTLFLFGIVLANTHDASYYADNIKYKKFSAYIADVTSDVEDRGKFYRAEAEVIKIKTDSGWQAASGKVLVYVYKDSVTKLTYGDRLFIKEPPQEIKAPYNPGEFDYKKYLSLHNIYHQQFLSPYGFSKISSQGIFFKSWAFYIRHTCDSILKAYIPSKQYPIASALVFGLKNTLDEEVKDAYTSTGTIHVLAVSGMHVVVIYAILLFLLGFIKNIKKGDLLLSAAMFILLWLYAFVTGFSPSVVRAVTMFSFVLVAQLINRKSNIYNTLALSAFVMLCFDPFLIMDAGFQLSYLSVIGIVVLYPPIYNLIEFKNTIAEKLWSMAVISVAAQIATLPLTIYYFSQFSISFLLANFVAIPLSSVALLTSMAVIACGWFAPLASLIGSITGIIIEIMNQGVLALNHIPYSSVKSVNISSMFSILLYLLIAALFLFFSLKKFNYLLLSFVILIVLSSSTSMRLWETGHQKQLIVFRIWNHRAVAFVKADKAELLTDSALFNDKAKLKRITAMLQKMNVSQINYKAADDIYNGKLVEWEGKKLFFTTLIRNYPNVDFLITGKVEGNSKPPVGSLVIVDSFKKRNNKEDVLINCFNVTRQGAFIKDI